MRVIFFVPLLVGAVPAFDNVLTMLQNLITQISNEEVSDEQDYKNFQAWFTQQSDSTSASVNMLQTRIGELGAVIADLSSRKNTLTGEVGRLNGEIDQENAQMQAAQTKRTQEHDSFVKEQLDFDNSIKACEKAVELLSAHYGDGKPKESTRPAWMAMVQTLRQVQKIAAVHKSPAASVLAKFLQQPSFLQQPDSAYAGSKGSDVYEAKTGEALSIVEQVKGLSETFAEDKQSSIDQERELSSAFDNLMKQKQALLAELMAQRDQQQSVLNQVSQELSENQNAEATAQGTLLDEQSYHSTITQQEKDTTELYQVRQEDRAAEKTAVNQAITVLSNEAPKAFVQNNVRSVVIHKAKLTLKLKQCSACHEVSQMLLAASKQLGSALLSTAAMTTGSGDALTPVIGQLQGLVQRLAEQQNAEEEHKSWCEHELSETGKTKAKHEALVEEFRGKISDTNALIAEKQQAISDTAESIQEADKGFEEVTAVRTKAKADFEAELQDYKDSITALNEAIDILADFYRDGASLVAVKAAPRTDAPAMATGGYEKKGGGAVVEILKTTRQDFAVGQKHLEEGEAQEVSDFVAAKAAYDKSRADLVDAGNRLAAELQGAQLALAQAQTDLADNEDKVAAAVSYLAQVGGSCTVLIDNFAKRSELRGDEKAAIEKAITVLQSAA